MCFVSQCAVVFLVSSLPCWRRFQFTNKRRIAWHQSPTCNCLWFEKQKQKQAEVNFFRFFSQKKIIINKLDDWKANGQRTTLSSDLIAIIEFDIFLRMLIYIYIVFFSIVVVESRTSWLRRRTNIGSRKKILNFYCNTKA